MDVPRDNPAEHAAAFRRYAPAVVPVAAIIGGILLDRRFRFDFTTWLLAGGLCAVVWCVLYCLRCHRMSAIALLLLVACVGGARHHRAHDVAASQDISRFARTESIPVRLRGTVQNSPVVVPPKECPIPAPWKQRDRTLVLVRCESIESSIGPLPVSGVVRLQVTGDPLKVEPGDDIEIDGWLAKPTGPRNPGDHDFREWLLRWNVRSLVYCEDPRAVKRLGTTNWTPRRTLARWREKADAVLAGNVNGRTHAVASAMLLGDRTNLNDDIRDAFIQSGMMHVLAISGMHVGLLAVLLYLLSRAIGLRSGGMAVVVLLGVVAYALITDVRPSIVRATIVIAVVVLGRALHRRSSMLNSLAIAALLILVWSPLDLFDVGAQLSFLAVLGMIVAAGLMRQTHSGETNLADLGERGPVSRNARRAGGWLLRAYVTLFGIWLFTMPLVAARFNVVSPAGLLLNVLLLPIVTMVLWAGYLLVFGGLLLPGIAALLAVPFDFGMTGILWVIDRGSELRFGHRYVAGPEDWWLWAYFSILFGILFVPAFARRKRLAVSAVLMWSVVAISAGLLPARRDGLRCTFLSVGHGVGVLIELPDGRTILYDAGSLGDGNRATRTVQSALWARGHSRLDALVVSHADVDHFNGGPKLLRTVPVGRLYIAKPFLDFEQEPVVIMCDAAKAEGVPIQIVRAGDRLDVGEGVGLRILHPDAAEYENDNAASIVVELTYAGRRILLTGDLEKSGLDRLMEIHREPVDVMLSPHHGSLSANPTELGEKLRPRTVIASCGRRVNLPVLRERYSDETRVLSTHHSGAVTVEISSDGALSVRRFVDDD